MAKDTQINLRVTPETQQQLKDICQHQHKTKTDVIAGLIQKEHAKLPDNAKTPPNT